MIVNDIDDELERLVLMYGLQAILEALHSNIVLTKIKNGISNSENYYLIQLQDDLEVAYNNYMNRYK